MKLHLPVRKYLLANYKYLDFSLFHIILYLLYRIPNYLCINRFAWYLRPGSYCVISNVSNNKHFPWKLESFGVQMVWVRHSNYFNLVSNTKVALSLKVNFFVIRYIYKRNHGMAVRSIWRQPWPFVKTPTNSVANYHT